MNLFFYIYASNKALLLIFRQEEYIENAVKKTQNVKKQLSASKIQNFLINSKSTQYQLLPASSTPLLPAMATPTSQQPLATSLPYQKEHQM